MKRPFLVFWTILFCIFCHAEEQFIFTRISKDEGFTSNVNCIYKEKNGDVWLGAPNGLYSFNGHNLTHHTDSLLKGCSVRHINTDKKGNFWILTDKGVFIRKAGEENLCRLKTDDMADRQNFFCMCMDKDGVWIGSHKKLYRYLYDEGRLNLFKELIDKESFAIQGMTMIDGNTILCSSFRGMVSVDTRTGEVSEAVYGPDKVVSAMLTDSKGRIWTASYNRGIEIFEKDGRLLRSYTTENSDLSNNIVLCMTEKDSTIWVGTDGGGVNIIDFERNKISVLRHISGDVSSFPAHSIKSIYSDEYDNIWAGSVRDGLIRISRSGMMTYRDSHIGTNNGLSNPTALCLFQDTKDGSIWIGTDGEGLNRFDKATGKFIHYKGTLRTKVVSIASYSDTELALSVYSDRIWLFNKNNGNMRQLELKDKELNHMIRYAGRSINLANENNSDLILFSNRMWRLDKESNSCRRILNPEKSVENGNYFIIGKTEEGLWFHDSFTIYLLGSGEEKLKKIGKLKDIQIKSGHFAEDGMIWLATDNGIYRFNPEVEFFDKISTDLIQDAVSIVCDKKSQVWIGTDSRLYAYLPDTGNFAMFGVSDGASQIEFLSKSRLLSSEGDIYMGGVEGLLCIDSDFCIDMEEDPLMILKELTADGERIHQEKNGTFILPRGTHNINISLSVQEKDIFREKMFRFHFSKESESYESSSPVLTMQRPPQAGKHYVTVSCTKRNGEWSEPVHVMTLVVQKPWYASWWFIAGSSFAVCLLALAVMISIIRRKEHRMQMTIKEKEQMMTAEKVNMLINISHELRTPLTLIMAPLKRFLDGMKPQDRGYEEMSRIYRQSRRMKDLLNMVLDLRKMEVGSMEMKIEATDFAEWMKETTEDIINEEHTQGIDMALDLSPEIGIIDMDRRKCNSILTNILINAVKHSSAGDMITVKAALTQNDMVRISVSDQGPGLHGLDPDKLFTRFYQNANEQYGSGIGLAYSKILVELHGGRIAAANNPDKGATFWWEIPVRSRSDTATHISAGAYLNRLMDYDSGDNFIAPERDIHDTSGTRLMLVDDSQDLLDFLREALCQNFTEIITVQSGNKAYEELLEGRLPDIIVSDVNMPDGNGYTLCKKIKENERYSHIPVILLTARGEQDSQSDSYRMGADAFMAKPFEIETLLELIRNILRQKADIRRRYLDKDDKAEVDYGSDEEKFILKLNKIIREHLDDPELDQQLLCMELGMSRAALFNKMKSITGAGAKEYITRIRLEKAKSLIDKSQLTIAEISEKTGFASQSYFSTAFKNYTGMTPSQYKKSGNR